MSARVLSESTLANAASVVATTNYPFQAKHYKPVAVQAVWTATTATMTLTLQYSCDNATWADFTTATNISDASGSVMWDIGVTKDAPYWRVLVTRTSGTLTTLKVYVAQQPR